MGDANLRQALEMENLCLLGIKNICFSVLYSLSPQLQVLNCAPLIMKHEFFFNSLYFYSLSVFGNTSLGQDKSR